MSPHITNTHTQTLKKEEKYTHTNSSTATRNTYQTR